MKALAPLLIVVASIITGCSSSNNTNPSDDDDQGVVIGDPVIVIIDASPVNLNGVAYTDTETEIFWSAAATNVVVVGYDIVRNGELIATKLDAKSYYDNTVMPGVSYEYEVFAVDAAGNKSEAAVVNIDTPPAYKAINADNYLPLTQYLFSIINGGFTDTSRKLVETLYSDGPSGNDNDLTELLSLVGTGYDQEAGLSFSDYSCQQGGTYRSLSIGSAFGGGGGEFDQCHINTEVADGNYDVSETLVKYVYNPGWIQDITYNLKLSDSAGNAVTVLEGASSESRGTYRHAWSWEIDKYESPARSGATRITDFTMQAAAGADALPSGEEPPFERTLTAQFNIQSAETGNKALTINTAETLNTGVATGGYRVGQLQVISDDESSMVIDFNTGDAKTFDITVITDGATFTDTLSIDSYPLLCVPSGAEANSPHPDNQFICG